MDPLDGDDYWPVSRIWERCVRAGRAWPMGLSVPETAVGPCYVYFAMLYQGLHRTWRFCPVTDTIEPLPGGAYFGVSQALDRCRREAAGADILAGLPSGV